MERHSEDLILIPSVLANFLSYLDKVHNPSVILYCVYNGAFFTL